MLNPDFPPKTNVVKEAEEKAFQEIASKIVDQKPLSPSERARADLSKNRDAIRLAVIREREARGRAKMAEERAAAELKEEKEKEEEESPETEEPVSFVKEKIMPVDELPPKEVPENKPLATPPKPKEKMKKIGDLSSLKSLKGNIPYTQEQIKTLSELTEEELRESLERAKIPAVGDKEVLVKRLLSHGLNKIEEELEPIEDWRGRELADKHQDIRQEMEHAIGKGIDQRARAAELRMKGREVAFARERGLGREHFETPIVVDRKVEKTDYKKFLEEAPAPIEIPAGRRRIGLPNRKEVSPGFGVQVQQKESGEIVARYERTGSGEQSEAILTGEATKQEALRKSIYERLRDGQKLSPLQHESLKNNQEVRDRLQKKRFLVKDDAMRTFAADEKKRFIEQDAKDEKERQIARDLIASRDLTPEQKELYKSKKVEERVKKMVANKDEYLRVPNFDVIAGTINKAYEQAGDDIEIDPMVADVFAKMNLEKSQMTKEHPDFFLLDKEKQVYVLHKIRQRISENAELDATDQFNKDISKIKVKGVFSLFEKISKGMRQYADKSIIKRDLIEKEKETGLANYREEMKYLVRHAKDLPYDISYDKDGKIMIQYEKRDSTFSRPEFVDEFNEAATRLSEIPLEWSFAGATKSQKKEYAEALEAYEIKKKAIYTRKAGRFEVLSDEERELREDQALSWLSQTDLAVTGNQLMTHSPELHEFEESEKAGFWENLKKMKIGRVPDFVQGLATGAVARAITRKTIGVTTGGIGITAWAAFSAWRSKEKEFLRREKDMRLGRGLDEKGERPAGAGELSAKDFLIPNGKLEKRGIKKFMNIKTAAEKINVLIGRIENARTAEDRDKMAAILKLRLQNVDEALRQGRYNPGGNKERGINRLKLIEAMSKANQIIFMTDKAGQVYMDNLKAKLVRFYEANKKSDSEAVRARNQAKVRSALTAATTASVATGIGFLVADYGHEIGSGQSTDDRMDEIINDGGDGTGNDVPEGIQPSNPRVVSPEGGLPVGSTYENSSDELLDSAPDSAQPESSGSIPVFDDSPSDLEGEVSDEMPGGGTTAENIIEPEPVPAAPESYELSSELKQNLIISPEGHITGINENYLGNFESVKDFRNSSKDFLADMSKSGLPKAYQGDSWGMQALTKYAPNEEKFLALQEVLAKMPEDSQYATDVRAQMVDLGEVIRKDLAAYAKDKAGVETLGNFFKPYEEWIGSSAIEKPLAPFDNLTASVEGVGLAPEPEVAEIPEAAPVEPPAPAPVTENITTAPEGHFTRSINEAGHPNISFDGEKGVRGELSFEPDAKGKVVTVEKDFSTDAGQEFMKNRDKYISSEQIKDMIANMKADPEVEEVPSPGGIARLMEDYVDRKAVLDAGVFEPEPQEAQILRGEMESLDETFKKYSKATIADRLDGIDSGKFSLSAFDQSEVVEEISNSSPEDLKWENIVDDEKSKIPETSKVLTEAEKIYGDAKRSGNMAIFKNGEVGFYGQSLDQNIAMQEALALSRSEGFSGERPIYEKGSKINGVYRVFYVFKK